jgi:multidrug efflux pump
MRLERDGKNKTAVSPIPFPLFSRTGAGAEVRSATGITVFASMIGVTLFGLFLTPVFYIGLRLLPGRKLAQHGTAR